MGKLQRIGILGGTFDPIHNGHLVTAEVVRVEFELEKVLFIPAANPPHKMGQSVTPAMHRYIMTAMATYSNPHFYVSSIEMERPGPSYTIDTIRALRKEYGGRAEFYFITGADAVADLPNWNEVDALLELCHFVATARPGCVQEVENVIAHFGTKGAARIHTIDTPELEISSTDIRNRVSRGRSIKYIVPESVESYIAKEGLYRK